MKTNESAVQKKVCADTPAEQVLRACGKNFDGTDVRGGIDFGKTPESASREVSISISGLYGWGTGWNEKQKSVYYSVLVPALCAAGFIFLPEKDTGFMDTLVCPAESIRRYRSDALCRLLGTDAVRRNSLTMHPMEFIGFAEEQYADLITEIINGTAGVSAECRCVPVPEISGTRAEEIISANAAAFLPAMRKLYARGYRADDAAFELVSEYRIRGFYRHPGSGVTCSDPDLCAFRNLYAAAASFGLLS